MGMNAVKYVISMVAYCTHAMQVTLIKGSNIWKRLTSLKKENKTWKYMIAREIDDLSIYINADMVGRERRACRYW